MLKSRIVVDLPSAETQRGKNVGEWLRGLFGAKLDLRSGREALTVSAFSLVTGLVEGFARAGVNNVVSFIVDKKVVYLDTSDVPDDLPLVQEAAEQKGILERKFKQMHLVVSHREGGLHVLIDVRIESQVVLGEAEMVATLSGRPTDLQIRVGEDAAAYGERIRALGADPARLEGARAQLGALTDRIAAGFRSSFVGARVDVEAAQIEIIRPEAQQLGHMRHLRFGKDVEQPHYRNVPTHHRSGAYADPFFYYYYDPYYDLASWMMLSSMMHHHHVWYDAPVHVVTPMGQPVADSASLASAGDGWVGADAVSMDPGGGMSVSESIPEVAESAGWGGGDIGSSDSGWGGGDVSSSDSGWGGGDVSSSSSTSCSSSASSCGSSCSSSSCGSSCGGGGGD